LLPLRKRRLLLGRLDATVAVEVARLQDPIEVRLEHLELHVRRTARRPVAKLPPDGSLTLRDRAPQLQAREALDAARPVLGHLVLADASRRARWREGCVRQRQQAQRRLEGCVRRQQQD